MFWLNHNLWMLNELDYDSKQQEFGVNIFKDSPPPHFIPKTPQTWISHMS